MLVLVGGWWSGGVRVSVWFNGVSYVCFNFVLTSLFLRDGFDLNAITGGSGNTLK